MKKYEKAKKYFQKVLDSAVKSGKSYELNQAGYSEISTAIEALEKQIPKKVIFGHDEQDAICCPNRETEIAMMDEYRYESVFYKHCPNCGQKLDWSDTE